MKGSREMNDELSATAASAKVLSRTPAARLARHIIESVSPSVDCGRFPAKRIVGDDCVVEADIFRDGHEVIRATIMWRRQQDLLFNQAPMEPVGNDRWRGQFPLRENTRYVFTIEAWTDRYASWMQDFVKKAGAGREVSSDLLEGVRLLQEIAAHTSGKARETLATAVTKARECLATRPADAVDFLATPEIETIAAEHGERFEANSYSPLLEVAADRRRARFGAWYEIFPRSLGAPGQSASLRTAERHLSYVRDLG